MGRPLLIVAAALIGCTSADFDVAPGPDAEVDAQSTDTSQPPGDTGVAPDTSTPIDDVVGTEVCTPNACGGCGPLTKEPGSACGLCGTAKIVCATPTTVKCDDPDDRTEGRDDYFKSYDGNGLTLSGTERVAISFALRRNGSPITVQLAMQRYDVSPGATVGNLQVRVIKGTPTATVDPGMVIATSLVAATLIPDTPNTITVTLPASPPMTAGTKLWVEITDHSDLSNFAVNGATGTVSDLGFYFSSGSAYAEKTSVDPYLVVGMNGCF